MKFHQSPKVDACASPLSGVDNLVADGRYEIVQQRMRRAPPYDYGKMQDSIYVTDLTGFYRAHSNKGVRIANLKPANGRKKDKNCRACDIIIY
jgi:hypothetical protein